MQCIVGRFLIPTFDVSSKCTIRAWVEKLNTYFHLNQMKNIEAIKMATWKLEGGTHDWWFHGIYMSGHVGDTSYEDLTWRLMEYFDLRHLKIHFKQLTQFKQTRSLEQYREDFLRLYVMVSDMSEAKRVFLFVEGIVYLLRGLVRLNRHTSL